MTSFYIDSNIILRFVMDDPEADKIEKLLRQKTKLVFTDVSFCEVVWVLESFYKWDRNKISKMLLSFLDLKSIKANKGLLFSTLKIYKDNNVDLIDAYLASLLIDSSSKIVYSYDKHFDKIEGVNRREP